MKSIYEYIQEIPIDRWHYYYGIRKDLPTEKPFIDFIDYKNYSNFILNYFRTGGKVNIFEACNINLDELRLPNHICSVFFLGILLYNETGFSKRYPLKNSGVGYETFPFIWFLIALFHDNAYQMEDKDQLKDVTSIPELIMKFNIDHSLLNREFSKCKELLKSRKSYFLYRKNEWEVVDHGILGGMLLFDRLVKIRREKKAKNEETLFWGDELEGQYETAANAISIHNIWLQSTSVCEKFDLKELIDFNPIKFKEFPLFYILGIVDTIEPLKTYQEDNICDTDILKSFNFEFGDKFIRVIESDESKVSIKKLFGKVVSLAGWLDVKIEIQHREFKVTFR